VTTIYRVLWRLAPTVYHKAIPRLTLRRKSATETVRPLLQELTDVIKLAGVGMSSLHARRIISSYASLSQGVFDWVRSVTDNSQQEKCAAKVHTFVQCTSSRSWHLQVIIKDLLDSVTLSCVPRVQSSIAQRTFEQYLPKFVVRSAVGDGWKEADGAISNLLVCSIRAHNPIYNFSFRQLTTPLTSICMPALNPYLWLTW